MAYRIASVPLDFRVPSLWLLILLVTAGSFSGDACAKRFGSTVRAGTAFRDRIANGVLDAGELNAVTGDDGSFTLRNGRGRVYLRGGFDIASGAPNTRLLTTPPAARAVGLLTALWQALKDRRQPAAKIRKMLNLRGNVTFVNFVAKPINQVRQNSRQATLIKRNAQHQVLAQFIKSLIRPVGASARRLQAPRAAVTCPEVTVEEDDAVRELACALISQMAERRRDWQAIDPVSADVVKALFAAVLPVPPPLSDADLTTVAQAAAGLNQRIEDSSSPEHISALSLRGVAEARLVSEGRYADLASFATGPIPALAFIDPDTGADPADRITKDRRPVLTGIVDPVSIKVRVYSDLDGPILQDEVTVAANGAWSHQPPQDLADGTYVYSFKGVNAENVETEFSAPARIVIQTTPPPAATVTTAPTADTTPEVKGSWVAAGNSLEVTLDGKTYSGSSLTTTADSWSLTIADTDALAPGTYPVTTLVTDQAGNTTAGGGSLIILTEPAGLFGSAAALPVGTRPIAVAGGDFNRDGKPDLAVANETGGTVSILRGNGDGSFQAAQNLTVGNGPYALAIADVNFAGGSDLVVANSGDNTVAILPGNVDGSFGSPILLNTGSTPHGLVLLQVNRDAFPDIAVANVNDSTLSVFLSDGIGGYPATPNLTLSGVANPSTIAAADLNGDDVEDLVAGSSGPTVAVFQGDGNGGFRTAATTTTGAGVTGVALADVNADGKVDIVTANNAGNSVSVLLNDGSGGFPSHVEYDAGEQARNVVIGDFDGDGRPDLAVTSTRGGSVGILRGVGDGTFQTPPASYITGAAAWGLALADFNADDKADLAVANWSAGTVSVLLNQRSNSLFLAGTDYPVAGLPYAIAAADLDGDAVADVATANLGDDSVELPGSVSVLRNQGTGTFAATVSYPTEINTALFGSIVVGALDTGTVADIMVSNGFDNSLSLLLGSGSGVFANPVRYGLPYAPTGLAAGLLDADAAPDLVVLGGGGVKVFASNGQVAVPTTPSFSYDISGLLQGAVLAQLDGATGPLDLAVTDAASNQLWVLYGQGDGSFSPPIGHATGANPMAVAAGDVNGDQATDLVVANFGSNTVSLFLAGDGFAPKRDFPVGFAPRSVALAYLNGDTNLDLIVASQAAATVSVLIGNGHGGFWPPVPYAVGGFAFSLAVADFNGDSKLDVATGNWGTSSVTVRLNASPSSPVSAVGWVDISSSTQLISP